MSMSASNKNHPELLVGEVFLTNIEDDEFLYFNSRMGVDSRSSWEKIGWRTKRRGMTAYDTDGNPINGMLPVFVEREELINGGINPDTLWGK
jgi:hypothetical protein